MMPETRAPFLPAAWIVLCAFLSCTGWILSALHQLNGAGYAVAFAIGAGALWFWRRRQPLLPKASFHKQRRRFRRALPLAFLVLACAAFLGGLIYLPSNYDGLAYRTPRVLHWLAEGRWHWIHAAFPRLNTRSCGFEWLTAPFIVFTKSDRGFFLINIVSLLLLPGLIFSALTRLGVRGRVAWHWMWLLASGYCFSLQAGSIQNDLLGAPYALAMMVFALRARVSHRAGDLWLSILSAALLTGSKPSNMALLLPWALAVLPCWRIPLQRPLATAAITLVAALSSFLPMAILNAKHCGDWTGMVIEHDFYGKNPVGRMAANGMVLCIHNLLPPVFPFARQWDEGMPHYLPPGLRDATGDTAEFEAPELATEEAAGLGFGVCMLFGVSLAALVVCHRQPAVSIKPRRGLDWLVLLAPFISALVLAEKAFVASAGARYFVPYYILLLAPFLTFAGHEWLVRRRWWQICALAVIALSTLIVALTPARPLWPARTVFSRLERRMPGPLVTRAGLVYSTYAERPDCFAPVRKFLPPDAGAIGLISFDDPETSLWRPFATHRIRHVLPGDTADDLRKQGIEFIVVGLDKFAYIFGAEETFDRWLVKMHAEVVQKVPLRLRAGSLNGGWRDWVIVRLTLSPNAGKLPSKL